MKTVFYYLTTLFIRTIDFDLHDLIATTGKEDDVFKSTVKALTNQEQLPLNFRPSDWKITDDISILQRPLLCP